jgi:hypothetical protein
MPQAEHPNGTTVLVKSIAARGNLIELNLVAINGSDETMQLSSQSDPMILVDRAGNQYLPAQTEVELKPYTTTDLQAEFVGTTTGDIQQLALQFNPKYGNQFTSPQLTIDSIPAQWGTAVEFAAYKPRQVTLPQSAIVRHPNGLSVMLKAMRVGERAIEVDFEAINGHEEAISVFDNTSDPPFLQDEQSNRYYLIPSTTNAKLSIPTSQKLTGTLRFAGQLPETNRQLSLHINDRFGGDQDFSKTPKIVIANLNF